MQGADQEIQPHPKYVASRKLTESAGRTRSFSAPTCRLRGRTCVPAWVNPRLGEHQRSDAGRADLIDEYRLALPARAGHRQNLFPTGLRSPTPLARPSPASGSVNTYRLSRGLSVLDLAAYLLSPSLLEGRDRFPNPKIKHSPAYKLFGLE